MAEAMVASIEAGMLWDLLLLGLVSIFSLPCFLFSLSAVVILLRAPVASTSGLRSALLWKIDELK